MEEPHSNSGDGKVLLKTTRGDIIINLFFDQAPQHCTYFMDWVMSVLDAEDIPCAQRVLKNFYIQFYFDECERARRIPNSHLSGKFDRPGLCAFSNHNVNQFIITLDPCDALDHKYTIFGEVSLETVPTLIAINNFEADDEIGDIYLLTSIHILTVPFPGYIPLINNNNINENNINENNNNGNNHFPFTLDSSFVLSPSEDRTPIASLTSEDEYDDISTTPVITPDTSIDTSLFSPPSPSPSHSPSPSPSSIITNTTTVTSVTSTVIETPSKNVSRHSSTTAFPVPSPKRPKIEPSPQKVTPISRSSTLLIDQQQCLMASHFHSNLRSDPYSKHPTISRSYSAPDIRMQFQPKWPKRLVIIRHGQSEQNACLDLYQDDIDSLLALASVRDADIKLTDYGKWQAEKTGKYLANSDQFDISVNTAELIAKELPYKLKIYKDNWLREKEFGRLHGLNEKTVREKFPLEYEIRNRDGKYWYRFPGGENYCDVEMRIHCFLEKLSRDYAGRSVLVVTHQVPYKLFRALLQHLDEDGVLKLEAVHNCGVQEYLLDRTKSNGGRLKLKTFNYISYKGTECPPHLATFTKNRG